MKYYVWYWSNTFCLRKKHQYRNIAKGKRHLKNSYLSEIKQNKKKKILENAKLPSCPLIWNTTMPSAFHNLPVRNEILLQSYRIRRKRYLKMLNCPVAYYYGIQQCQMFFISYLQEMKYHWIWRYKKKKILENAKLPSFPILWNTTMSSVLHNSPVRNEISLQFYRIRRQRYLKMLDYPVAH